LLKFDFSERIHDFDYIRAKAMRAIEILGSERAQKRLLEARKRDRELRLTKMRRGMKPGQVHSISKRALT
jgi:hypothetical protein